MGHPRQGPQSEGPITHTGKGEQCCADQCGDGGLQASFGGACSVATACLVFCCGAEGACKTRLNSVGRIEAADEPLPESEFVGAVVQPTLAIAEQYFSAALREINVADLVRQALRVRGHGLHSFDTHEAKLG